MKNYKTPEEINIQDKLIKIHSQFGTSEIATYKIQLLFDMYGKQQYNKAVFDCVENAEVCFTEDCVILRGDAEVDKDSMLKLIKE